MFGARLHRRLRTMCLSGRSLSTQVTSVPPTRLPVEECAVVDPNPGSRRVLLEGVRLTEGGARLNFEVATAKDLQLVGQAFTEHFANSNNLCSHSKLTYDELAPLSFSLVATCLEASLSVLVFDGKRLVAYNIASLLERAAFPVVFPNGIGHERPLTAFAHDYGQRTEEGPFASRKTNQIAVMLEEAVRQAGPFVPRDTERIAMVEAGGILPPYLGALSRLIVEQSFQLYREAGCDFTMGVCVAKASQNVFKRNGYDTLIEFPYDRFRVNDKPVFANLPDGTASALVMARKL